MLLENLHHINRTSLWKVRTFIVNARTGGTIKYFNNHRSTDKPYQISRNICHDNDNTRSLNGSQSNADQHFRVQEQLLLYRIEKSIKETGKMHAPCCKADHLFLIQIVGRCTT